MMSQVNRDIMSNELPIHDINAFELFLNQAGIALEKALLKKRSAEHLKERK
jgi:hypothetical protein